MINKKLANFNSIKVQLEQDFVAPRERSRSSFQFHKGTIRTPFIIICTIAVFNFNSIKVQLELDNLDVGFHRLVVFQFHKGTIRTTSSGASILISSFISIP